MTWRLFLVIFAVAAGIWYAWILTVNIGQMLNELAAIFSWILQQGAP